MMHLLLCCFMALLVICSRPLKACHLIYIVIDSLAVVIYNLTQLVLLQTSNNKKDNQMVR